MSVNHFVLDSRRALILCVVMLTTVAGLCYVNRPDTTAQEAESEALVDAATPPVAPKGHLVASAEASLSLSPEQARETWKDSIDENLTRLKNGLEQLESVPQYTARFYKQELVHSEMTDPQLIELRVRHEPFSVYMKWLAGERGQEVLYVDGVYDGRMLVKLAGWKSRLLPALKIDPNGNQAMSKSRYPVTEAGLAAITRKLINDREADLELADGVTCRVFPNEQCNDRACICYVIEYDRPGIRREYRKSIQYVDQEHNLPICVRNFTWPKDDGDSEDLTVDQLDERTMIELYSYSELDLDWRLAETEFQRGHDEYRFSRR